MRGHRRGAHSRCRRPPARTRAARAATPRSRAESRRASTPCASSFSSVPTAADGIIPALSPGRLHGRPLMLYPALRPLLFTLDPETAHDLTLVGLDAAAC